MKIIRSDRCGEFYGRYDETGQHPGPFARLLQKLRIVAQYTTPGSPWQNGVAERRNRTYMEMVISMMSHANLPISLWMDALRTAVYILIEFHVRPFQSLLLNFGKDENLV